MSEEFAKTWIEDRWGSAAIDKLHRYSEMITEESLSQNLVSKTTLDEIWQRHFLDSAQLVPLADTTRIDREWIDIGSGAGLPGIVAAILQNRPVRLVEPRRRRGEFLQTVVSAMGLNAQVEVTSASKMTVAQSPAVVSARAVSDLIGLFRMSLGFVSSETILLFPKGRSGLSELEQAKESWHGVFHVEQSLTASDSIIVVARGIKPK